MRKKHLVSILALLMGFCAAAQESISLNVVYTFTYVRDAANKDQPYTTNMVLSLGKQSSRYCSEKLYKDNDKEILLARKKQQEEQQSSGARPMVVVSGGPLLIINKHGAIINEELVKDIPGRKVNIYAALGFKTYVTETPLPAIDWQVQPEKKTIGQYNCQKAVGTYAGRTYEAWFTPDLPFQDGPWKLSGLPGLILEAQDTKQEVSFAFKELSRNEDADEKITSFLSSDRNIKTGFKDYLQMREAFETDPEAVMAAMAPNARLAVKNIDDPAAKHATRIRQYNPLELE